MCWESSCLLINVFRADTNGTRAQTMLNWFCHSLKGTFNIMKFLYLAWQLTFNIHLLSLCFITELWMKFAKCHLKGHRTNAPFSLLLVYILSPPPITDSRAELKPYRKALHLQRVLRCKSIRDGARQYIFIVEAQCELPVHDLLQRETKLPNTWPRAILSQIIPPIHFLRVCLLCMCVSFWTFVLFLSLNATSK